MEKDLSLPVSIYALGGLGEVGKNTYCFENNETIVMIDAGVRFPGAEFPGIDYIIPDYTHLKNNRKKVKALFITHGHEDHIGGIPFLLQNIDIPVIYAPKLAAALIKNRLEENKMLERTRIVEYDEKTVLRIDLFSISFFRVTHSIPDSFGVVIDTPEGRIVSTGDFKIDLTPIGPDIQLNRLSELGDKGVDLLLSDSTNAEREGYTPSEKNVFESIEEVFDNAPGRLIISTFSSNVSRIQQICEAALLRNRKIVILGRSMEKVVDIARDYGYIKIPDNMIIPSKDVKLYKNSEILILCTGSQGEPMAALSRIATGDHKEIHIAPGDTVVFSSSPIPGNGLMIDHVVNQLSRCGAEVVTNTIINDIHSSGHPSKQELRLMLKLIKPKYFMPMHGDYRMLLIHSQIAQSLGMKPENTFVLDNGDCLTLWHHKVTKGYQVEHGNVYIDGKDINGLADAVMNDRKSLMDEGMVVVSVSIDTVSNILLHEPDVLVKGIINQGSKSMIEEVKNSVSNAIKNKLLTKTSFSELKAVIRNVSSSIIEQKNGCHPIIIPVIMSEIK